jgi:anaerobic selenocysteine-containing dehydrogenase
VKGFPEVRSEYPIATLADEIETPGEGQVRALITVGGNPALSAPNSERLDAAFAGLDFMVSVDPYLNETTRHADVVLPPPSALARSSYDLAFYGLSVRNIANYSPAIVETDGPSEADILAKLALVVSGMGADADPAVIHGLLLDQVISRAGDQLGDLEREQIDEMLGDRAPADRAVDIMIRTGPYGDGFGAKPGGLSLDLLEEHPHGIDLGPLTPQLPQALRTSTGRIDLVPEPIVGDVPRLVDDLRRDRDGELVLVGRRDLRSNNSWMHNIEVLVKGKERCTLHVHPDDASRLGLDDGKQATITSRVGSIEVPVEVTDRVLSGVVSLPHGWGHSMPGTRMSVAADHAGANTNALTDDSVIDPLSGNAVLNGIPVTVSPA